MRVAIVPLALRWALGLGVLALPGLAVAQSPGGGAIQIGWEQNGKPAAVEFSTGDVNARRFEDKGSHFLGKLPEPRLAARHDFVIRWDGIREVTLRVRPRSAGEPAGTEGFRIRKPNPAMPCNNSNVAALRQQALGGGRDNRLSIMIQSIVLLRQSGAPCNAANKAILATLMFSLNQQIAQDVDAVVFDFSPDVVELYNSIFRGNTQALQRLATARRAVAGRLAEPALATLKLLRRPGQDPAALDRHLTQLIAAAGDDDFSAALAERRIKVADLRAMRPSSPIRLAVAGPKWLGVKAGSAASIAREDAMIAESDLMREGDAGASEKDVAAPADASDAANDTAKDPAELMADPAETVLERAANPMEDAVAPRGPDAGLEAGIASDVSTLEDAATRDQGPG